MARIYVGTSTNVGWPSAMFLGLMFIGFATLMWTAVVIGILVGLVVLALLWWFAVLLNVTGKKINEWDKWNATRQRKG